MLVSSKIKDKFADALRREGLWFKQNARLRDGLYSADFYLRTKRGAGLIVALEGSEDNGHATKIDKTLRADGFRVVRFTRDEINADARGLARSVSARFHPELAKDAARKLRVEMREIRAMLNAHDSETVGKLFTRRGTRKGKRR